MSDWRQRAERQRRQKAQLLRHDALRRLRRMEEAAMARLAIEGYRGESHELLLDSERYAAPLLERLGARGRIQLLLWGAMAGIGLCAIVSFFSAPLMGVDLAVETMLVGFMLILSYAM